MSNPFQEQLLKAGVVTRQQVNRVNQEKKKKKKKQRQGSAASAQDEHAKRLQQQAERKAQHDRELNRQREEQAKNRAISIEIDQLIDQHRLKRGDNCEIAYHFEHNNKVHRLYIDADMQRSLAQGRLGIARKQGRYELVPLEIAQKIQQRNEKRVIIASDETPACTEDDPYADYQVPDDLMW